MNSSPLRLAISEAQKSDAEQKHGCVILDSSGRVIARGYNQKKTHPKQTFYASRVNQKKKVHLHAEIAALVKCRKAPHRLYVVRVNGKNKVMNSKPCAMCMLAIREAGVRQVVYSTGIDTLTGKPTLAIKGVFEDAISDQSHKQECIK